MNDLKKIIDLYVKDEKIKRQKFTKELQQYLSDLLKIITKEIENERS